jgi:hypothetical protein
MLRLQMLWLSLSLCDYDSNRQNSMAPDIVGKCIETGALDTPHRLFDSVPYRFLLNVIVAFYRR